MHLRLCYNCLTPGHASKMCHSTKTCRMCGSQHHSSLCFKTRTNSSDNTSQNTNVSQGKTNQSSSSSSANQRSTKAQAQTHPNNKPVVTPNKPQTSQASDQSPTLDTTYVTNVNSSNFPNNVLPTATLNVGYCNQQANVRAFFDTGSHRSFISPEVVKRLNLRVIKQVPVNLCTFGNDTESCMLDLVKVKIRFGKSKIPLTMLVHDSAAMGYFHSPGLFEVAQKLENKGFDLADQHITSDALTGIEILIGVDNFTRLIVRQKRSLGTSLFVTRGGGVISFGPLPRWATTTSQQSNHTRCARIICENKPELEVTQLWELERVGIIPESFSPSERETISLVRSNMQQSESGYIVQLPFKDDTRRSVNYRTARGQLNHLVQRAENDEQFGQHYSKVVSTYVDKEFIEQIPNHPVEGHYMPHHAVFKKSATTPLRIVFNASSKPNEGKSLNDCLLTGSSLTAKLHEILVQFRQGTHAITADKSKAFHRIIVEPEHRKLLKFLWQNLETHELLTYQFKVVLFGATCSPYLLQETLHTHLSQSVESNKFVDKFYVDTYMNTYDNQDEPITDKVTLDNVMNEASMPLQEWVSNCDVPNKGEKLPRSADGSLGASKGFPTPLTSSLMLPKPPRTKVREYAWRRNEICMLIRLLKPSETKKEKQNHRKGGEVTAPHLIYEKAMTSLSPYEKAMTSLSLSRQKSEGENQQDSGYTDRRKLGTDQIIPIYQCKTSMYSVNPSESRKEQKESQLKVPDLTLLH